MRSSCINFATSEIIHNQVLTAGSMHSEDHLLQCSLLCWGWCSCLVGGSRHSMRCAEQQGCRYYMAMGASKIVAEPLTITGSIGVVTGKFNLEELYRRVQYSKVVISKGK